MISASDHVVVKALSSSSCVFPSFLNFFIRVFFNLFSPFSFFLSFSIFIFLTFVKIFFHFFQFFLLHFSFFHVVFFFFCFFLRCSKSVDSSWPQLHHDSRLSSYVKKHFLARLGVSLWALFSFCFSFFFFSFIFHLFWELRRVGFMPTWRNGVKHFVERHYFVST